jgi:hypothetical protein
MGALAADWRLKVGFSKALMSETGNGPISHQSERGVASRWGYHNGSPSENTGCLEAGCLWRQGIVDLKISASGNTCFELEIEQARLSTRYDVLKRRLWPMGVAPEEMATL